MADKLFTVRIDVSKPKEILKRHGLEKGGRVQAFFTSEVMRKSDPYVPMSGAKSFSFSANPKKVRPTDDYGAIVYDLPYARFHWYGRVMIYEPTGSTYAPKYGKKVRTNRPMKYYQGNTKEALRGPHWVTRAWLDNKDDIIKSTEEFARKKE